MCSRWDLSAIAKEVIRFRSDRDWAQFHTPKNLVAGLTIEAAELQENFLWEDNLPANEVIKDAQRVELVAQEMADVAVYLVMLAHDLDINLAAAVTSKLRDNARRYPADEYRGRTDKAPH